MSLPAIFTVYGGKELRDFLNAPFLRDISRKPRTEPPRRYTKRLFDRAKNPEFRHIEAECFIARELITPKGRIAAFMDPARNAHTGEKRGCFGYFEAVEDPDVARSLMRPALGWLREKGALEAVGPAGLTPLWPAGLGPDAPAWYGPSIEAQGFGVLSRGVFGAVDAGSDAPPPKDGAEVTRSDGLGPGPDIERLCAILYEHAAPDEPVSVTPEGLAYVLRLMGRLAGKGRIVIAHRDGLDVGAAAVIPDPRPVFMAMKGSILPFGWLKCLLGTIKTGRAVVLGPFGPDIPAAMSVLLPEILKTGRDMGASEVVFHDKAGEEGPLMTAIKGFGPKLSPGYVLYGRKL